MSKPSGPVQTPFPGLLGLLNLKNVGLLPDELLGTLQPIINGEEFMLRGSLQGWNAAATRNFVAGNYNSMTGWTVGSITVPGNECWWVENYTYTVAAAGAGALLNATRPMFQTPGGTNPSFALGTERQAVTAAEPVIAVSARDFWLPPGAVLGFWIGQVTVNPVDIALWGLRYAPLRV